MKLNLINNKEDRNLVMAKDETGQINLVELLKKFNNFYHEPEWTEEMVSNFYKVNSKCINQIGTRNSEELSNYGYRVIKGDDLKNLRTTSCSLQISPKTRALRLYPIKAVILIGMMLTESKVAEKLRDDIMNIIFGDSIVNSANTSIESTINNAVDNAINRKSPRLIGSKDFQKKIIVRTIKDVLNISLKSENIAGYNAIVNTLFLRYGVDKLENIPYSESIPKEILKIGVEINKEVYGKKTMIQKSLF